MRQAVLIIHNPSNTQSSDTTKTPVTTQGPDTVQISYARQGPSLTYLCAASSSAPVLTVITNALTVTVEAPLTVDIRWTLSITVNAVVKVFHSNWAVCEAWTVDRSVGGMVNGGYGWGALVSLAERIHWREGKIISIMGHSILCHTHPKTSEIWEKVLAKGEEIWPKNIWPENTKSTQPSLCLEGCG